MSIKFLIYRQDLLGALRFLTPFLKPFRKDDCKDDDEPYFADKVTFSFHNGKLKLYILVDNLIIEREISNVVGCDDISFCLPFIYLKSEVERRDCEVFKFVEDRFFGFMVYDALAEGHLFDVEAFSTRLQILPTSVKNDSNLRSLNIERTILIDILSKFNKYTIQDNIVLPQYKYKSFIWCTICDGTLTALATTGDILLQKKYSTAVTGKHFFAIPGLYANGIKDVINRWPNKPYQCVEYTSVTCRIRNNNESVVFSMQSTFPIYIYKALEVKQVNLTATMLVDDMLSSINMKKVMDCDSEPMVLHFLYDHVNIYCYGSLNNHRMFEFKDVSNCNKDYVCYVQGELLKTLLDDIDGEYVNFKLVGDDMLYISSKDEDVCGDTIRILATYKKTEDIPDLLLEGDASLQSHPNYLDKYYKDKDEEESEEEEFDPDADYAALDEMYEEAVSRMKSINLYSGVIEAFQEDKEPQVYEPPYGASYFMEEEELEEIHNLEKKDKILVWGVIRSFLKSEGDYEPIDHYLIVTKNKKYWEEERRDLIDEMPFVYIAMGDHKSYDYGHINIYMSPGGTPLEE